MHGHRSDDRHEPRLDDGVYGARVDFHRAAYEPELGLHNPRAQHATINAGQADGPAVERQDRRHDRLVNQPSQHGHHNVKARLVGNPKPVDEPRPNPLPFHPFGDDLGATVNDDRLHSLFLNTHQVFKSRVVTPQDTAANFYKYRPIAVGSLLWSWVTTEARLFRGVLRVSLPASVQSSGAARAWCHHPNTSLAITAEIPSILSSDGEPPGRHGCPLFAPIGPLEPLRTPHTLPCIGAPHPVRPRRPASDVADDLGRSGGRLLTGLPANVRGATQQGPG